MPRDKRDRPRKPNADRQARRASRREELLDAAIRVIRREGAHASMDQIAREGGVTKPILYRHFGDRDGLVQALGQRFATGLMNQLVTALGRPEQGNDLVSETIDAYLSFVERDPEVYRFVVQQSLRAQPETAAALGGFIRQVGQRVAVVLGEQLRAAGVDSGGAEPLAHGIVGMVHSAGDWWLENRSMPRERVTEYLATLLWAGLEGLGLSRQQLVEAGRAPQLIAGEQS
jgi:AcrR family transcriptional regulator